ncbi:MAG: hypothetical protein ACI9ES_001168 [Oceanospirillaceae bacterium]|jgi:hypothetical protein
MKALIEKVLIYLPQYLTDFGAIISGPKTFVATKNTQPDIYFNDALLFLGISIALSVILRIPSLNDSTDIWQQLSLHGVTVLVAVSVYSVILRFAWCIVGGKASIKSFFVTYAYFGGVLFILGLLIEIIKVGAFKTIDLASL